MTMEEFNSLPVKQREAMRWEYDKWIANNDRMRDCGRDFLGAGGKTGDFAHYIELSIYHGPGGVANGVVCMPGYFAWCHIEKNGKVEWISLD
jgi:hypothetical protein